MNKKKTKQIRKATFSERVSEGDRKRLDQHKAKLRSRQATERKNAVECGQILWSLGARMQPAEKALFDPQRGAGTLEHVIDRETMAQAMGERVPVQVLPADHSGSGKPITQKELGDYLGLTQPTMSRALRGYAFKCATGRVGGRKEVAAWFRAVHWTARKPKPGGLNPGQSEEETISEASPKPAEDMTAEATFKAALEYLKEAKRLDKNGNIAAMVDAIFERIERFETIEERTGTDG